MIYQMYIFKKPRQLLCEKITSSIDNQSLDYNGVCGLSFLEDPIRIMTDNCHYPVQSKLSTVLFELTRALQDV